VQRWRRIPVLGDQRPIVATILVLIVLIPTVMLVLRIQEPSRNQAPFGWQMHTTCWGIEGGLCD
jgi:hypothetical protein